MRIVFLLYWIFLDRNVAKFVILPNSKSLPQEPKSYPIVVKPEVYTPNAQPGPLSGQWEFWEGDCDQEEKNSLQLF